MSRALQIVTLCCCVCSQTGCYSPEITACQVTCAEAGGNCPEGTACTGGYCIPPGVEASTCRAGVDGGAGTDGGPFVVPSGMVMIPNDSPFLMGCVEGDLLCSSDESPSHAVTLSPYVIDIAEVTVGEYAECVAAVRCVAPTASETLFYRPDTDPDWPVTGMNRDTATVYCDWRMKRLPTEAEWEKAARGTNAANIYPWGSAEPTCADRAQFIASVDCEPPNPADVKSFATGMSDYGLYDMSGNVWEWVADWNGPYATDAVTDPQGPAMAPASGDTGILRGGGWRTGSVVFMRASNRNARPHTLRSNTYGMRCAGDVP